MWAAAHGCTLRIALENRLQSVSAPYAMRQALSLPMQNSSILPAILILTILLWSNEARAVILGQTDDFGTGAQNWANGHGAGSVALGGPAGASDQFLNVVADGSQANGRLTIFNRNQWLGSYITAGVTEIDMDLKDFGTVPATLSIRLVFKQSTAGMNTPGYLSTTPFTLSNDGQWHHATFQISAAAMTARFGPTPFTTLMSAPAEFRI